MILLSTYMAMEIKVKDANIIHVVQINQVQEDTIPIWHS